MHDPTPDPSDLLPTPDELRIRLAHAQRQVNILSGLLRLAEKVASKDGRPVRGTLRGPARKAVACVG